MLHYQDDFFEEWTVYTQRHGLLRCSYLEASYFFGLVTSDMVSCHHQHTLLGRSNTGKYLLHIEMKLTSRCSLYLVACSRSSHICIPFCINQAPNSYFLLPISLPFDTSYILGSMLSCHTQISRADQLEAWC